MKFIKEHKFIVLTLAAVAAITSMICFGYYRYTHALSALSIESVPDSLVFVNGEQKGKTPIELELRGDEAKIRLLPEDISGSAPSYETTVKLTQGVRTIVRHVFSNDDVYSQTETISFEKIASSDISLAVVTIPDGVHVSVDNKPQGVSPIRVDNLLKGRHRIEVSADGYRSRSIDVQTVEGYLLTAFIDLAEDENYVKPAEDVPLVLSDQIESDAQEVEELDVKILDTPTGFLRVRDNPGIDGQEIGRAIPGQIYHVLSLNAEDGWYEINFESTASGTLTDSGWISAQFASASARLKDDEEK